MIIKTLILASFVIASAFASGDEPFPAALLVQSNFDFSLTRKEFRVHYGGVRAGSPTPKQVFIKIYSPDGEEALSYDLKEEEERKKSQAFHFALDGVESGKYQVEVCADGECSARTPSLTDVVTSSSTHKLSCKQKSNNEPIEVTFDEPTSGDWAIPADYPAFSGIINNARREAGWKGDNYKTEFEKHEMDSNPFYKKDKKIFHITIKYDLTKYRDLFDTAKVNEYCGRKYMLSLHSHIVDKATKKVVHRYKTVNHLSEAGKKLFILTDDGGKILLESTHEDVDIKDGTYKLLVSLCVTNKDTIESTYCANPITKDIKVAQGVLTSL